MSAVAFVDLLLRALRDIQSTRYAELASSAIIVFDHLITIDDEVELIWKSSWSIGKVLFVINRYYTLVSVILNNYALFAPTLSDSFCAHFFKWQGWTGLIACMIAEVILQMRLYALYFLDKKVLVLMITSFIVASASSATIMGIVLSQITVTAHPIPGHTFCVPFGVPKYFYAFWIPILTFESLLCGLALVRGFQTFRSSGTLFQSGRHLVSILIRDSVLYFLIMFATYFTNLLVWVAGNDNLLEIPIGFSVAMSCVLGNRIILNVRQVNKELVESKRAQTDLEGTQPGTKYSSAYPSSENVRGALSDIEMSQLRSMRAASSHGHSHIVV